MFLLRLRQIYARYMHATVEFTTQVLKCDPFSISFPPTSDQPEITSQETLDALKSAAHNLVDLNQTVVFPTETVYGLGALHWTVMLLPRYFYKAAPDNPLIVHVSSITMLNSLLPPGYTIPKPIRS
ncbi:hypothetical protein NLJ89_g12422 [Agrocybe chaxingu]|uniref:Uncharacterized protein n=1 Tax=Agrocybe chaxingu TaxID=84603 RepID=A0A9W8JMB8_9AGAR|nr:hypothetical protein NLJ89_g12422 [Agrocybe chaxingu]